MSYPKKDIIVLSIILICSIIYSFQALNIVTTECVKPFKLNIAPRFALSRCEIVEALYRDHGLQNRLVDSQATEHL